MQPSDENGKSYVSVVYDENRTPKTDYPSKFARHLIDRFSIAKQASLIELGCGRGDFLLEFQQAGLQCYGIDRDEQSISLLANLIDVRKADISVDALPFDDNTFDVVYHKSLIEHLYTPDHLMAESYRILKPGGRVIILTPDWISQMKTFYEDFTHSRPYDCSAINDLLEIYNFKDITSEKFYQLPILWAFPSLKIVCRCLQLFLDNITARQLTKLTGVKFFRWGVELMVLGSGVK